MSKIKTYAYDPADFLETEEDWAGYLSECIRIDDGDGRTVREALNAIARAKGLTKVAKEAGMTRQGLTKALSDKGNPEMTTFLNVVRALGMELTASCS